MCWVFCQSMMMVRKGLSQKIVTISYRLLLVMGYYPSRTSETRETPRNQSQLGRLHPRLRLTSSPSVGAVVRPQHEESLTPVLGFGPTPGAPELAFGATRRAKPPQSVGRVAFAEERPLVRRTRNSTWKWLSTWDETDEQRRFHQ